MRWTRVVGVSVVLGAMAVPAAQAIPQGGLPKPGDIAVTVARTACDEVWVDDLCQPYAYPDPQYRTTTEPHVGTPLQLHVGVVHEHSGYSDGDPTQRPADYFRAASTGHNTTANGSDTGIILDYLLSSEHSENEKLPVTTAAACLDPTVALSDLGAALSCFNIIQADHYRKWEDTLRQANQATDRTGGAYTGFTAMRGFEFTNDYYNHLGVYFSRNVKNAKIDGSYVTTEAFWSWLRTPPSRGGGSDALVVFNHPGGLPGLTPFDDSAFIGDALQATIGGANWHDYAYVPDVDDQVSGMEVNRGDDLSWFVRALDNGWHIGPIGPEDHHQRAWSSSDLAKTVMVTRGRSPQDYAWALQHNRTMAYGPDVVNGSPRQHASYPSVQFWADGPSVDAPGASPLGSRLRGGPHSLELSATGLAPGSRAVLVHRGGGTPIALGTAGADGRIRGTRSVTAPAQGEGWWAVVVCGRDSTKCGQDEAYDVVTAPIWVRAT